jgi:hypothetical protein
MALHHTRFIAMDGANRKRTGTGQLTGLGECLVAGRGACLESFADLLGNTL